MHHDFVLLYPFFGLYPNVYQTLTVVFRHPPMSIFYLAQVPKPNDHLYVACVTRTHNNRDGHQGAFVLTPLKL